MKHFVINIDIFIGARDVKFSNSTLPSSSMDKKTNREGLCYMYNEQMTLLVRK